MSCPTVHCTHVRHVVTALSAHNISVGIVNCTQVGSVTASFDIVTVFLVQSLPNSNYETAHVLA